MSTNCIFCNIIAKELPTPFIEETDNLVVIKDIAPKAPVHFLIIPKKHIEDIQSFTDEDSKLAGDIFLMAKKLSKQLPKNGDFKLVVNSGHEAGQRVYHVHFHFLAGKTFSEV